jgi:tetratricopeptide (TPR) repeat protein
MGVSGYRVPIGWRIPIVDGHLNGLTGILIAGLTQEQLGMNRYTGLLALGLSLSGLLGGGIPWPRPASLLPPALAQPSPLRAQMLAADRLFAAQQYEVALTRYQQALAQGPAVDDAVYLQTQISRTLLLLERYEVAIPVLESVISQRQQVGGYGLEPAQSNLGLAYYHTGQLSQAESVLRQAIRGWEAIRAGAELDDLDKVTLFEQQAYTYTLLQRVLIAQGKSEAALVLSEAGRARALVEQLAQQAAPHRSLVAPPDLAEIQRFARQEQATLVTYSILGDGRRVLGNELDTETELLIWVIQPSGEITTKTVSLQPVWQQFRERMDNLTPLESLVHSSRAALGVGSRGFGDFSWASSNVRRPTQVPDLEAVSLKSLYQLLIHPIEAVLPAQRGARVIFVPQRSLFLVPFAALRDETGTYLIEKYTLAVSPSIQVLALTQHHPPSPWMGLPLWWATRSRCPYCPRVIRNRYRLCRGLSRRPLRSQPSSKPIPGSARPLRKRPSASNSPVNPFSTLPPTA